MNADLIRRWNKKVRENDIVYHLGDFSWKDGKESLDIFNALNGHKRLVIGNHDHGTPKVFNFSWESIDIYKEITDNGRQVILFHYPIWEWDRKHYGSYHLYGHIHNNKVFTMEKAYNVGVEVIGYEPKTLDELAGV